MDTTTITLSLPTEIVRDVERIAQERNVSIDTVMAEIMEKFVRWEEQYAAAKEDYFSILAQDIFAGNNGEPLGPADELHEL